MIPQCNPKASYRAQREEIDRAIREVFERGQFILGEECEAFEREFASYLGVADAVGVANGTDAVELALRAWGVRPGDRVVTVSHTAVATVAAIERCGAVPVLVDITPGDYTMDPELLEATLRTQERVRAVVVVHLYGMPAAIDRIRSLCRSQGIGLVEDCAQAHGASVGGQMLGSWGDLAAFSFYPTKNLGAFGDGGAVATNNPALAAEVRLLRQYGWRTRYISDVPGQNSRLDEIQAAILRVKLRKLTEANQHRRHLASIYDAGLMGTSVVCPPPHPGHVYHQYVVRLRNRSDLISYLRGHGVGTAIHYPNPVHGQPAYAGRLESGARGLECTERIAQGIVSLPMFPELEPAAAAEVVARIHDWQAAL